MKKHGRFFGLLAGGIVAVSATNATAQSKIRQTNDASLAGTVVALQPAAGSGQTNGQAAGKESAEMAKMRQELNEMKATLIETNQKLVETLKVVETLKLAETQENLEVVPVYVEIPRWRLDSWAAYAAAAGVSILCKAAITIGNSR